MIQHLPIAPYDARDADWLNDILQAYSGLTLSERDFATGGIDRFRFSSFPASRLLNLVTTGTTPSVSSASWTDIGALSTGSVSGEVGDRIDVRLQGQFTQLTGGSAHGAPASQTVDIRVTVDGDEECRYTYTPGEDRDPFILIEGSHTIGSLGAKAVLVQAQVSSGTAYFAGRLLARRHRAQG